jgi:anti-sigma factor RsiW
MNDKVKCAFGDGRLHDWIDGRLSSAEADAVREHVALCPHCADSAAAFRAAGDLLRAWSAETVRKGDPRLDAMWTRVRAGIAEKEAAKRNRLRWRHLFWVPAAAALAVFALLVYPSVVGRGPITPGDFRVAVERIDSETSTVALLDRGDEFPQVIWISDEDESQG